MRHNLIIFVGQNLKCLTEKAAEYMTYGDTKVLPYVHVYNLIPKDQNEGGINVYHNIFRPESRNGIDKIATKTEKYDISHTDQGVRSFVEDVFRRNVTLATVTGGPMTLTIISENNADEVELSKNIISAAGASALDFNIDTLTLSEAVSRDVLHIEQNATDAISLKDTLSVYIDLKNANRKLKHIVCIDQYNANGISVNFNIQSLGYMLGEYCILTVDHYLDVYPQSLDSTQEFPLNALGMSVLNFNTEYFLKYLRNKALLKVMEKEGVGITEIDINKASLESQKYLIAQDKKVKNFWKEKIVAFEQSGQNHEEIVAMAAEEVDSLFGDMKEGLKEIIENPKLTLPFKQAVLAQIISEDNEHSIGQMFNTDQLAIDDMVAEPLQFFIDNENSAKKFYANLREECKSQGLAIPDDPTILTRPLDENGKLYNPLPLIKKLRYSIKTSIDYIRHTEEQIEGYSRQLKNVEQGEKRITGEGYVYGGVTYHVSEIVDTPLQETYEAKDKKERQIDLRKRFTPIKEQGALNACTSFAVTSVLEYILKTQTNVDYNFSELFLYYNTRAIEGNTDKDTGSSVYNAIQTLSKEGICSEADVPYVTGNFNQQPSDEAYAEASKRRVLEAKNVRREIEDIKSAISEGYPVIISLRITNDFGQGPKGFISMPTDDEIDGIEGSHAMVIVGYADEEKFFIVRNSWGTEFGDEGYCYIPYRYIADTRLLNAAYIITKTTFDGAKLEIKKVQKVSFNSTDASIQIAILSNLVAEEKNNLAALKDTYSKVMGDFSHLLARVQNGGIRDTIKENTIDVNNAEIEKIRNTEDAIFHQRQEDLIALRRKAYKVAGYSALSIILLCVIGYFCIDSLNDLTRILLSISLVVLYCVAFFTWYKTGKDSIRRVHDDALEHQAKKKYELEHKNEVTALYTYINGMFISKFVDYRKHVAETYDTLRSFNLNLASWQEIIKKSMETMEPDEEIPFVPILENERLDKYFDDNVSRLTDDIWLYPLLQQYTLDDKSIEGLKDQLNAHIEKSLYENIRDFSMSKFVLDASRYPYLKPSSTADRISLMENRAIPFMRYTPDIANNTKTSNVFFTDVDPGMHTLFIDNLNIYCKDRPFVADSNDKFKLTLVRNKYLSLTEIVS